MSNKPVFQKEMTAVSAESKHQNVLINNGSAPQIMNNMGTINVNIDNDNLASQILSALAIAQQKKTASYAMLWPTLSSSYYNLFVIENEYYDGGVISIAKDRALRRFTPVDIYNKHKALTLECIESLKAMPCIFATRNKGYACTEENHLFYVGRLSDIFSQGECLKFRYEIFQSFPQQKLNENAGLFNLFTSSQRNELDEEHWAIKSCNLLDVFNKLNLVIR